MPDVPQPPRERKDPEPSLVIRRLDALIAAAEALLEAWHPILEAGGYPRSLWFFDDFVYNLHAWRESATEMHTVTTSAAPPLALFDADARRAWLDQLRSSIDDMVAAGDDATRPPGRRTLGRATARRHILEARHALRSLVEMAARGMETS